MKFSHGAVLLKPACEKSTTLVDFGNLPLFVLGSLFNSRQNGIVFVQNRQGPDVAFKRLLIPKVAQGLNNAF